MDAVKEKRYYGWYMVMVSAIIYALVYSTTSTGSVFTISITQEQGFSRSLWSSKSIFTCIGSLISCYMSGRLIQRFGLKRIMLISTAGVASTWWEKAGPGFIRVNNAADYLKTLQCQSYESISGSGLRKRALPSVLPWQAPEWEACSCRRC